MEQAPIGKSSAGMAGGKRRIRRCSPEIHGEQHSSPASGRFLRLPMNRTGRDIVVGDIHGEIDLLNFGLGSLGFDPTRDRLICTGDLIDRGPGSAEVLEMIEGSPWFYSVLGNHESLMLGVLDDVPNPVASQLWPCVGGEWIDTVSFKRRSNLRGIVQALPLAIEIPTADGRRVGIVHAEVPRRAQWGEVTRIHTAHPGEISTSSRSLVSSLLWGRRRFNALQRAIRSGSRSTASEVPVLGVDQVICGHNILSEPREPAVWGNHLLIDTGAFEPDGCLTFVDLHDCRYAQAQKVFAGLLAFRPPRPLSLAAEDHEAT